MTKRMANSVEFMGQVVSYPQYIRLRRIQAEVIKMDKASKYALRNTHRPTVYRITYV